MGLPRSPERVVGAERRRSRRWVGHSRCCDHLHATEKRTHDYLAWCDESVRSVARRAPAESSVSANPPGTRQLPGLPEKAVKPYADKETYVVLDNLSTHTAPDVCGWLEKKSARRLPAPQPHLVPRTRHTPGPPCPTRSGEPSPMRHPTFVCAHRWRSGPLRVIGAQDSTRPVPNRD